MGDSSGPVMASAGGGPIRAGLGAGPSMAGCGGADGTGVDGTGLADIRFLCGSSVSRLASLAVRRTWAMDSNWYWCGFNCWTLSCASVVDVALLLLLKQVWAALYRVLCASMTMIACAARGAVSGSAGRVISRTSATCNCLSCMDRITAMASVMSRPWILEISVSLLYMSDSDDKAASSDDLKVLTLGGSLALFCFLRSSLIS